MLAVEFSSLCPTRQQLMSNLPCALRRVVAWYPHVCNTSRQQGSIVATATFCKKGTRALSIDQVYGLVSRSFASFMSELTRCISCKARSVR
jgi:hypothetical protein